ncbi:MAG: hypothetical protein JWM95_561 [Gemmatimonadetes bacterium]|nr:hypothetical protein [Gemmatimonadota bacterium]
MQPKAALTFTVASLLLSLGVPTVSRLRPFFESLDESTLVRAELMTRTPGDDGDNKDHDTGVFVEVRTADGVTRVANISNGDSDTEYRDDGHVAYLVLHVDSSAIDESKCATIKFRVGIAAKGGLMGEHNGQLVVNGVPIWDLPSGNDRWVFVPGIVLRFSSGHKLVYSGGRQDLRSTAGNLVWTNWITATSTLDRD